MSDEYQEPDQINEQPSPPPLPKVNLKKRNLRNHKSAENIVSKWATETVKPHIFTLHFGPVSLAESENSKSDVRAKAPTPFSGDKDPTDDQIIQYMVNVQKYINKLGYLLEGEPKIQVDTTKSIRYQVETAKQIIKAGEGIKCYQALVLGLYFTNCIPDMERFTLSFKYTHQGKEYIHVVLIITLGGFAVIGISRHSALHELNTPNGIFCLSNLINEFKSTFKNLGLVLTEVKIGGFIPHDSHSLDHIDWGTRGLKGNELEDSAGIDKIGTSMADKMLWNWGNRMRGFAEQQHNPKAKSK